MVDAARIALSAVRGASTRVVEARFVLFGASAYAVFDEELRATA
ncbi:hypothetical protein [Sphaerisporangium sp. NPDC051011]